MEICPNHPGSYCLLKTGIKESASKGLSFYVCSKCKFAKQTNIQPTKCSMHSNKTVELQQFVSVKGEISIRKYYRCDGRQEGKSWCGFKQIIPDSSGVTSHAGVDSSRNPDISSSSARGANEKLGSKAHVEDASSRDLDFARHNTHDANDKLVKKIHTEAPSSREQNIVGCNESDANKKLMKKRGVQENYIVISSDEECDDEQSSKSEDRKLDLQNGFSNLNREKDGKKDKVSSLLSFSDLNKENDMPSSHLIFSNLKEENDVHSSRLKLQSKSFHQYRDSPDPLKRSGKGVSASKPDSGSSDSDSDVEVQGAKDLLQGLTLKDGITKKTVTDDKMNVSAYDSDIKGSESEAVVRSLEDLKNGSMSKNVKGVEESKIETNGSENKGTETKAFEDEIVKKSSENVGNGNTLKKGEEVEENKKKSHVDPQVHLRSLKDDRVWAMTELNKLQASLRAVKVELLPDKGERILSKVASLKQHIASLDRQIGVLVPDNGPNAKRVTDKTHAKTQPQVIRVFPGVNNTTTVHVRSGVPQVVATGESSKSKDPSVVDSAKDPRVMQLPPYLSHMFAANPQAMTLYGGRMTSQRLREVGSITKEAIDKLHKQLDSCPSETTEVLDPDGLLVSLMPHQRQALAWLDWREKQHPPGGILADDMGLGKTLTMISHILRNKTKSQEDGWLGKDKIANKLKAGLKKSRATLVVAPASLVHQWAKEIERRCKAKCLKFLIYHGPNRETSIHRLIDNDVVLTTYAIVSKEVGAAGDAEKAVKDDEDEEDDQANTAELPTLLRIGWERIILDEAHDIKNHKSLRSQSVCRLRAAYRWALTGTPIQNDLKDIYSLLRFLRFSPFDEFKVWKKQIENAKASTTRLNLLVKVLLLRRTKDQTTLSGKPLVELPDKKFEKITVELSPEEKRIYDKLYQRTQSTVRAYVHRHQDPLRPDDPSWKRQTPSDTKTNAMSGAVVEGGGSGVGGVGQGPTKNTGSQILVLLLRLRQCCSHLSLMKSHLETESIESEGIELSLQQQMKGLLIDEDLEVAPPTNDLPQTSSLFDISTLSTKLSCIMEKVKNLQLEKPSDKCVIVSQWVGMLNIVAHHLRKCKISYSLIQGNIPPKKRADVVDDFNQAGKGAKVLLVSLCAGGVGLNLIGGNHLFMLDSHWNPALEEQACDRIYRIGQKKEVNIYRFICKDTIEEKIWVLQQGKLSLAKSVLSGAGTKNQKLSLQDLQMLFGV